MATITITENITNILEVNKPIAIIEIPDFDTSLFVPSTTFTAKGDILAGTGSGTYTKVAAGVDGTVLVASASAAGGVAFQAVAGLTNSTLILELFLPTIEWTAGNGLTYIPVPLMLNGKNLQYIYVDGIVVASTSGTPTVQVHNLTDGVDMLSTVLTVDANETTSRTAATPPVIDTAHDDVATGDILRIDIDVAGTGTKGGYLTLEFG